MIQVTQPHLLFKGQKVYRLCGNVEKTVKSEPSVKLIAIYENVAAELTPARKEILDKLIVACKYKPEDVIYINTGLNKVLLNSLQSQYSPEVILIFGEIEISRNLTNLKKNYPFEMNGVKILRTETLDKLEKVAGEKSLLWASLKRMLNL